MKTLRTAMPIRPRVYPFSEKRGGCAHNIFQNPFSKVSAAERRQSVAPGASPGFLSTRSQPRRGERVLGILRPYGATFQKNTGPGLAPGATLCGRSAAEYSSLLRALITVCGSFLFFRPGPGEGTEHSVVALMAGVFEYPALGFRHGNLYGPRLCKCRRILDCELVEKRIRIHAPETFDETHVLARSPESRLVREIRGLDNQGLAFPMAARVSLPQPDILWKMRTAIEGDDTGFMAHLDENRDVSRPLYDLSIVVIGRGEYWRPGALHDETTFGQRPILRAVEFMSPVLRRALGLSFPRRRCQGRNPSVRRIDDQ